MDKSVVIRFIALKLVILNTNCFFSSSFSKDDKPWLPQGPKFRQNEDGVKRFAQGYLAYAGGGPNTRGNQFMYVK